MPRAFAARTKSMICGWMVGSPPENCTTSGLPSVRDKIVQHRLHFFQRQAEAGARSAKHSGQSILQALLTSMMPRQACCWWSGHRPQS